MKPRLIVLLALALTLAAGGYVLYQNSFVPVPLASADPLYVPASPDYGQDAVVLEAVVPAGPSLATFLRNQSDLALLAHLPDGTFAGQLLAGLQRSRNGKRWRLAFRPGWRLQDGSALDAQRAGKVLAAEAASAGAAVRVLDPGTLELRFRSRAEDVPDRLAQWRIPGSGPFVRRGTELVRFDGFALGRAGLAGLRVATDPAALESRAWADGLAARRWAWAAYPGRVEPDDMARARLAPYDEVHLKDGSVWFLSRRLRRFRPERGAWPETRLFGVWQGDMDLPREPEAP